ncbi:2-oxoacid:ferredoxin oxidoreductase subunit alpha [Caminibacter pacificus]|uniref:2-oxoacid:ferredoxin oxidoreductase subunit alpha n=1 Tax=Caminibacter pacificus TaxID=1424653 RepID=A0AAJ4UY32_9BACT|nr:2-oxoacid:ferredoxin oxidoreductase subunit alpha [Caminibacter pacificus]QCI27679.1 2-oxoacid:ferredoxin oxidoreductase subunit alpha [Caminibacter pacificus]ROR40146.1 pyruvate ferredoxin oxidoreductase alpha subunit [Caminibacter pacificus]
MAERYELKNKEVWDGNMAAAHALRQAQVDVVAAYPITPSTPIVQNYAQFLADGYVDGEFVMVESEHSAMSACVGAAAAGGRVATATSSQGYALMVEVLYQASGMRLPIVMTVVNRALASPLNIHGDHSDLYLGRDAGWIHLIANNPQEAYDLTLCAFRIGEDDRVRLPVTTNQDGFLVSHTAQVVEPLQDEDAYKFVGEYKAKNPMLDTKNPVTYGAQTEEEWHFEHKANQHKALMDSFPVIEEVFKEFEKVSGRKYNLVETYKLDDADVALVLMGSAYETAMLAVDKAREEGIKVGLLMPRVFRPFPYNEVAEKLKGVKAVAALDRSAPMGTTGALYNEVAGALAAKGESAILTNYIYGLGGRDTTVEHILEVIKETNENAKAGKRVTPLQGFINLRGPKLSFN